LEAFVQSMMERLGPFGIGLLMFLENIFPPIPSELIMPLAGYLATQGDMNILWVIVAGSVGSLIGTLPWYYLGRRLGQRRGSAFGLQAWSVAHDVTIGRRCGLRAVQATWQGTSFQWGKEPA